MSQRTRKYDMFKPSRLNRPFNLEKAKHMKKSLQEMNLLEMFPLLVNSNFEIQDGQHRLWAAKELGLDVFYNIIDEERAMIIVNNNQSRWIFDNYVHYYVEKGFPDYKKFEELRERYPFVPKTSLANLLMGKKPAIGGGSAGWSATNAIRNGEFKITNLEGTIDIVEQIRDMEAYLMDGVTQSRVFYRAYKRLNEHEEFDFEHLLERFKLSGQKLYLHNTEKEYLQAIENIYNYKMPKPVRFY